MDDYGLGLAPAEPALTPQEGSALLRIVTAIIGYKNRNSRYLAEQFRELPDPTLYPKYYQLVQHPRSLNAVLSNLQHGLYTSPAQVFADLKLVFVNVGLANTRSSLPAQDAVRMEAVLEDFWETEADLPRVAELAANVVDPSGLLIEGGLGLNDAGSPPAETGVMDYDDPDQPIASSSTSRSPRKKPRLTMPGEENATVESVSHLASFTGHLHTAGAMGFGGGAYGQYGDQTPYGSQPGTPGGPGTPIASTSTVGGGGQHVKIKRPVGRPRKYPLSNTTAAPATPVQQQPPPPTQAQPPPAQVVYASAVPSVVATGGVRAGSEEAEGSQMGKEKKEEELVADDEVGWLRDPVGKDRNSLYVDIVLRLLAEADPSTGRFLSTPIVSVPSQEEHPEYYAKIQPPYVSLQIIDDKAKKGVYTSSQAFDQDLAKLFRDARAWIPREDKLRWGDVVSVQRLWQEITKTDNVLAPLPPPTPAAQSLSSVPVGPGQPGMAETAAASRTAKADRTLLESINFKGETIKTGDWVHIMNAEDPAKPVVAQVFGCYKKTDSHQRCISVCWYYRPEQTVHGVQRNFYEHEVFRTGTFMDHHVEDYLEKCCGMFIKSYTRGRPKYPYWSSDMPTYVIESRYKDDTKSFKKIKDWENCLPKSAKRDDRYDQLDLFERPYQPLRVHSPFAPREGATEAFAAPEEPVQAEAYDAPLEANVAAAAVLEKRGNPIVAPTPPLSQPATPSAALSRPPPIPQRPQPTSAAQTPTSAHPGHASRLSLPHVRQQQQQAQPPTPAALPARPGVSEIEVAAHAETFDPLPPTVVKHFRSDPATGELLWFAAPPIAAPEVEQPQHSLTYLAHLGKRKRSGDQGVRRHSKQRTLSLIDSLELAVEALEHEVDQL